MKLDEILYERFETAEKIEQELKRSYPVLYIRVIDEEDYENTIDENVTDFDNSLCIDFGRTKEEMEDGWNSAKVFYLKDNGGRYFVTEVGGFLDDIDNYCVETQKEISPIIFGRLDETILNAVKKVFDEAVCDFENWWQDDFETDYAFKTKEELDEFSGNDLECIKCDWIQWISDVFVANVCNEFGILFYDNNKTNSQEILIEELYEIVKEQLWERIK